MFELFYDDLTFNKEVAREIIPLAENKKVLTQKIVARIIIMCLYIDEYEIINILNETEIKPTADDFIKAFTFYDDVFPDITLLIDKLIKQMNLDLDSIKNIINNCLLYNLNFRKTIKYIASLDISMEELVEMINNEATTNSSSDSDSDSD